MTPLAQSLALQSVLAWLGHAGEPDLRRRVEDAAELPAIAQLLHSPAEADGREGSLEPRADEQLSSLSRRLGLSPKPFWPDARPYAVALTHDVDRVLATLHRARGPQPFGARARKLAHDLSTAAFKRWHARNPFYNFERMQSIERELGIRSASYVLFERRRWLRALKNCEPQHVIGVYQPRAIAAELVRYEGQGNEVGLHASFSSWNSAVALRRERQALEQLGVHEVSGGRTHYLNFDERQTPAAWRATGLAYDSSIGFNFTVGFRSGTSFPYHIPCGVLELPLHLMDTTLRFVAPDWSERRRLAMQMLERVRASGGVLTCNWHFQVMNEHAFPEEMELLRALIERAKQDGAWLALPREIAARWAQRVVTA